MKRLFVTLMILLSGALQVNAGEVTNVLNSIEIDSLKDTYNITLNTKSNINVKRTIQSSDNMILTLKDIKPSKSLNTVYKNAAEVDSIMVEPVSDSVLKVSIKANNISNSAISVEAEDSTAEGLAATNSKSVLKTKKSKANKSEKIVLSAPIAAYEPVYKEDTDLLEDEEAFAGATILDKIKNFLSQGNISNIISTGLIGIILFCGIKLFRKEETDTVVGLTQSLKEREMNLYKDLSMRRNSTCILESQQQVDSQVKTPVLSQFSKPNVNPNAGYGMKAYQSSSKNPYMTSDIMMKRAVTPAQVSSSQKAAPQPRVMSTVGSRIPQSNLGINRPVQSMQVQPAKASNIDSMKFLESMTQIYEKNGRSDLAQGLKAGMLKAKANK